MNTKKGAGDPNCPNCGGLGYVRGDYPVEHPDFGKLQICVCRKEELSRRTRNHLFSLSHLNELRDLTFENFEPGGRTGTTPLHSDSLNFAYNNAKLFSRGESKPWLLLHGKFGCGKTHLAAAIANVSVEKGIKTLFITVPDLLDLLRFSFGSSETTFEDRFHEIRECPLLILDDFGTHNATSWAEEKIFQIINYRYINRLPLVITTNLNLLEIEPRIRSRILDPELVDKIFINAPDYRNPKLDENFHELSSLEIHANHTFSTFSLRKEENLQKDQKQNIVKISKAMEDFAKNPTGWILLIGDFGSGKTHLAAAVANHQSSLGNSPIFVSVPDLLQHLRATFNPNSPVSYDQRFEEIRTSRLLILDDLEADTPSTWVKEKLYQLFNYRYHAELPTVITTYHQVESFDARLKNWFSDTALCRRLVLTVPSYTSQKRK